ncbi:ATP-binding protein [Longimicrobium sp.]|uniref:ATP-binding protein n=1 Tax=Longimicrobium sp. TaxID=2029185 RepID=UPI002E364041|nr:ATP-binding protein [Longimicrobium sp.]HEX6037083.1 ATP-binding protein [Longimicrobium sp.]
MTRVVAVPPTLDSDAFDALIAEASRAGDERVLFDARHVRFADPYGMTGLLALGEYFTRDEVRPILQFPQSSDVAGYFTRMGFVAAAEDVFEMHDAPRAKPAENSVLLPITVVGSPDDVHGVIEQLNEHRIGKLLSEQLGYSQVDAMAFSMLLSEVSQNIVEHAEGAGWVGIQTYRRWRRIDKRVVVIAVADLGVGFRGSLEREHAARFGDRWSDATALEAAFIHGVTRFRDPGRGQGLKQIRKRVLRWGGKIAIRSGTARIADVPDWDDGEPLVTALAAFPGAQILIVLPARDPAPPQQAAPPARGTRPGVRPGIRRP